MIIHCDQKIFYVPILATPKLNSKQNLRLCLLPGAAFSKLYSPRKLKRDRYVFHPILPKIHVQIIFLF